MHRALRDWKIDLVILDIMLPGMDGWQLLRLIRSRGDTPVLFLSALGQVDDRVRGLQAGGDDYLVKPVRPARLGERLLDVLAQTHRERPGDDPDAPERPDADTYWVLEG